jgi:transposase
MLEPMAYSKNPFLPRVRMEAVNLVRLKGWGVREAARYIGVAPGTISKWVARAPKKGSQGIPTLSSRPEHSPNRISEQIECLIVEERKKHSECGEVIYQTLLKQGVTVSLSSVHRTLDRYSLTKKRSIWKRRHRSEPRPDIVLPGNLVEVDTIHIMKGQEERTYVYTLIDVASRWAYAWASEKINVWQSIFFVRNALRQASLPFQMLQSDHGPEFSQHFSERISIPHRHSRVRMPNDQSHVERFNRTIQEKCLRYVEPLYYNQAIETWLRYYNHERLHMGYSKPVGTSF